MNEIIKVKPNKNLEKNNLGDIMNMNVSEFQKIFPHYLSFLHKKMKEDLFFNKIHLSPGSGLMNDPNGLVEKDGIKHIFYQWVPYQPHHLKKHWGHYQTKDFINYQFSGVALEPSLAAERDGVFSGGAINFKNQIYLFWTGNLLESINQNFARSAYTLQGIWDDQKQKVINKKPLFEVEKNLYTGHFRDPMPFIYQDKIYLLHGTQNKNKKGAFALYQASNIEGPFKHLGKLEWTNPLASDAYMYECPDLIKLAGKYYLIFSPQGALFFPNNQNRDNCLIVPVDLDFKNLKIINNQNYQFLDYGFDFYAPQTMTLADGRTILLAWGGISDSEPVPTLKAGYAHLMTSPRELIVKNNLIYQKPVEEYQKLRAKKIIFKNQTFLLKRQAEILGKDLPNQFRIKLVNEDNHFLLIDYQDGFLTIDRSKMSYGQTEKYGKQRKHQIKIKKLHLFLDSSFLEIFINDGLFCFSLKYWLTGKIFLQLSKNLEAKIQGYYLKPLNIDWGDFYA